MLSEPVSGTLRAEMGTGCDKCMWTVQSAVAWSVSELQLFSDSSPRNPLHFDCIEGRRISVSDTLCAKIGAPDTKNTVSSFFGYMWHVVHNRENLQLRFLQEVAVFPEWQLGLRFFCLFCALSQTWTFKSGGLFLVVVFGLTFRSRLCFCFSRLFGSPPVVSLWWRSLRPFRHYWYESAPGPFSGCAGNQTTDYSASGGRST